MIVVAGENLVDLAVRPDGSVTATPGGGPYNVARALGRLGVDVAYLGRISTDRFGQILRQRLVDDGVDLSLAATTDDPTLLAVAELADDGSATYRFHTAGTAAAGLTASVIGAGLPAQMTALHVGTLGLVLEPMATAIEALVETSGASSELVFVDLNIRPAAIRDESAYRARLDRVLGRADVIKASVEDLAWLEPTRTVDDAVRALLRRTHVVLATDGPNPVRLATTAGIELLQVPPVEVLDTIGSGDALGAGFLAEWLATATATGADRPIDDDLGRLRRATEIAIRVGSATATRAGAEPPTRAELEAHVAEAAPA